MRMRYSTDWVGQLGLDSLQMQRIARLCAAVASRQPEPLGSEQVIVLERMAQELWQVDDTLGARSLILDEWIDAWAAWAVGPGGLQLGFAAAGGAFLSTCLAHVGERGAKPTSKLSSHDR